MEESGNIFNSTFGRASIYVAVLCGLIVGCVAGYALFCGVYYSLDSLREKNLSLRKDTPEWIVILPER